MKRYIKCYDSNYISKMSLALSQSTPLDILNELALDDDYYVRYHVAQNTSTPPDALRQLAKEDNPNIRFRVSINPKTPPDTLRQLAQDDDTYVRKAVCINSNAPHDVLEALAEDDDASVRTYARKSLNKIDEPSKPKRLSWSKLISQLRREAEDGVDSLYEQTSAGSELESICSGVEGKLGIWLEPSIQGGQGGIWFYSSEDDSTLASDYDYQTYNENVISLALNSKNVTEFRNKYKDFIQHILDDPAYAPDEDE